MSVTRVGPGRYRLDWYDHAGVRRRMVLRAPSKEAALRTLAELQLDAKRVGLGLEAEAPNVRGWTVRDLLTWWMRHTARAHASPARTRSAVRTLLLRGELPDLMADRLATASIEDHLESLSVEGYAPETVNHARRHLHAAYASAIKARKLNLAGNPVAATTQRRVPRRGLQTLTHQEVRLLLASTEDPTRAIYAVALYAGLRRGEIWALRRADVDLEHGTIHVHRSHDRGSTKGGAARVVPIHPELRPHLARMMLGATSELLFPSPVTGGLRSADAKTSRDLAAVLKRAGIARALRFHDLRHTCATLLLQAGVSLAVVQRVLGHSTPVLTANVYGHLAVGDLAREMGRLQIDGVQNLPGGEGFAVNGGPLGAGGEQ